MITHTMFQCASNTTHIHVVLHTTGAWRLVQPPMALGEGRCRAELRHHLRLAFGMQWGGLAQERGGVQGAPGSAGGKTIGKPWENGGLIVFYWDLPSGNLSRNCGKSPRLVRKFTISMANFNSHVELPEGRYFHAIWPWRAGISMGLSIEYCWIRISCGFILLGWSVGRFFLPRNAGSVWDSMEFSISNKWNLILIETWTQLI